MTSLLTASVGVSLTATPALAHDQLVAASPHDDEQLSSAPAEVRLSFDGEPLELGTIVMVTTADDPSTDVAEATVVDGRDVVAGLPELPDGHYDVRWRVVSSDGHPISGVVPFSVGDAGARAEAEEHLPPSPEAADSDAAEPSGGAMELPAAIRTVLIAIGGAGLGVLVLWLIGRVRRRS